MTTIKESQEAEKILFIDGAYIIKSPYYEKPLICDNGPNNAVNGNVNLYGDTQWIKTVLNETSTNYQAQWILVKDEDSEYYEIRNRANGQLLIVGDSGKPGGKVMVYGNRDGGWGEGKDNPQKKWLLRLVTSKFKSGPLSSSSKRLYRIQNKANGQFLAVSNSIDSFTYTTEVVTDNFNSNNENTVWEIEKAGRLKLIKITYGITESKHEIARREVHKLTNDSDEKQRLVNSKFSIEIESRASFEWNNSFTFGYEASFSAGIFGSKVENTFKFENTFSLGETKEHSTKIIKEYEVGVDIPARSHLELEFVLYKDNNQIPFTATFETEGGMTFEQKGIMNVEYGSAEIGCIARQKSIDSQSYTQLIPNLKKID